MTQGCVLPVALGEALEVGSPRGPRHHGALCRRAKSTLRSRVSSAWWGVGGGSNKRSRRLSTVLGSASKRTKATTGAKGSSIARDGVINPSQSGVAPRGAG